MEDLIQVVGFAAAIIVELCRLREMGCFKFNIEWLCLCWSLQLFSQDSRVVLRDSMQSSKRRRMEHGWETLRDHLQPHHSDFDMIPW